MAVAVSRSILKNHLGLYLKEEEHMIPTKITSTGELTGLWEYTKVDTPSGCVYAKDLKDGDEVKTVWSSSKIKNVKRFVSSHLVTILEDGKPFLVCGPLLKVGHPYTDGVQFLYAKDCEPATLEYAYHKDFALYNMVSFEVEGNGTDFESTAFMAEGVTLNF